MISQSIRHWRPSAALSTLLSLVFGCLIIMAAASITDWAYAGHQAAMVREQQLIAERVQEAETTPTPFALGQQGQVLSQSMDRWQQYYYLQDHVTNWDTPCFRQAIAAAKQYQPRASAFDYLVSELWQCAE